MRLEILTQSARQCADEALFCLYWTKMKVGCVFAASNRGVDAPPLPSELVVR